MERPLGGSPVREALQLCCYIDAKGLQQDLLLLWVLLLQFQKQAASIVKSHAAARSKRCRCCYPLLLLQQMPCLAPLHDVPLPRRVACGQGPSVVL